MTTAKTQGAQAPQNGSEAPPKQETLPAKREEKVLNVNPLIQESVDDRIRKVMALNELVLQRKQLLHHLERIQAMKFGEFDEKDFIELVSNNGNHRYPIKSVALCKKVSDLMEYEIEQRIAEIEMQIQFG